MVWLGNVSFGFYMVHYIALTEVRRLFEPVATGLAATRISVEGLAEVRGHLEAMRARHRDWCLELAARAEAQLWTAEETVWVERLDALEAVLRAPRSGRFAVRIGS